MGKLTPIETIKWRLGQRDTETHRARLRKWRVLREIVAGDMSSIYDRSAFGIMGWSGPNDEDIDALPANVRSSEHPAKHIEINEVVTGRVNVLMRYMKSLNQQVGIQIPQFAFQGLRDPDEIEFHQNYLEWSWGSEFGCHAMEAFDLALWDMYVCGIGFPSNTLSNGSPKVSRYDPMDIVYDETGATTSEMEWVGIWDTRRYSEWVAVFGEDALGENLENSVRTENRAITLVFYYDKSGECGTSAVFMPDESGSIKGAPIEHTESPFYADIPINEHATARRVFLPVTPLVYMHPAGYASPMSLVENMVGLAVQIMHIDAQIQRQTAVPPVKVIAWDALHEQTQEQIKAGETPEWWIAKDAGSGPPVQYVPPPPVDSQLLMLRENLMRALQELSDDNPYSGGTQQGVDFAREVEEMAAKSGKGLAMATRKLSGCMSDVATKHLLLAREFEESPAAFQVDKEDLSFDDVDQIRLYINPKARPVVKENTLRYASIEEKIGRARALIADVKSASPEMAAMMAPQLLEEVVTAHEHAGLTEFIRSGQAQTAGVMG